MSLEPATTAKVVLYTSNKKLEIELWAKEIPSSSMAFIQNCLNKTYTGQTFNRVLKNSLIQSDSKDPKYLLNLEKHPRLKFSKRGLVGLVADDASKCTADSFFITCRDTPELNASHTIIGKIAGDSYYTVVNINDGEIKDGDLPIHPVEITDCEVIEKYFKDLEPQPQEVPETPKKVEQKKPKKSKVKLNLEFEDDAEDDGSFQIRSAFERSKKDKEENTNESHVNPVTVVKQSDLQNDQAENDPVDEETNGSHKTNGAAEIFQTGIDEQSPEVNETKASSHKLTLVRDPTVDSDFDPYLDLSAEEDVDPELIFQHTFKAST
ncbi:peptidyl-prolyl isomerase Cwc27p [[Candida] railenensis]|uniref:Peptidyl-prolyl isomerase Cwc27p n=1 Tax=[Candida] railenensis TaxID=45579 RepID=A0A9P0QUF6_9ASCO|nr:peptidyl-prolyl isomerase Cwc27p [[Candida] railenensis]